jgi:hypothetical protein
MSSSPETQQTPIHLHWRKAIVWGAAYFGEACFDILSSLEIEVLYFVDRCPPPSGKFCGLPVHKSDEFLEAGVCSGADVIIFSMWADPKEMRDALRAKGYLGDFATFRGGGSERDILGNKRQLVGPRLFSFFPNEDSRLLGAVGRFLSSWPSIVLQGSGKLSAYLLEHIPDLRTRVRGIINEPKEESATLQCHGIPIISLADTLPSDTILLTATAYLDRLDISQHFLSHLRQDQIWDWDRLIAALPDDEKPWHAFEDREFNIYPLSIPSITFEPGNDMILLDPPARFLGMLPNGLGYVHNILVGTGINFQTVDLDMIFYHRFHSHRLLDNHSTLYSPKGQALPLDPWAVDSVEDFWHNPDMIEYFRPEIEKTVAGLIAANPKILGLSLHGTNRLLANELIRRLRQASPEIVIVVGGYDCNNPDIGPRVIPDYDYMVIFEAENSLPALVRAILDGHNNVHVPGVVPGSRQRGPLPHSFVPAELPNDLDALGYPQYEWADTRLYRNYNNYQLIPIVLSRGCRWSRCNFCGERFFWRRRSPTNVADEIEWFADQGGNLFHFNDSDLSGDPEAVRQVCEEVIRRGIQGITMVGQLRVQKGYTPDYFHVLREAGFRTLRYGIDGWSKSTLKLHKKGYTLGMIEEVLAYTKAAGISVAINLVIGIPHETESDISETIANMIRNRDNFDIIENLNTLILTTGSVYWTDPEKFGITLHEDRESLIGRFPVAIPSNLWHSTEPYIDQEVRLNRLHRILEAAEEHQIKIGGYANWKVKKINKEHEDRQRKNTQTD